MKDLLVVEGLGKIFGSKKFLQAEYAVTALRDVSFTLGKGETVGVVGESGCGKSTLARCVLDLITPTTGSVLFDDTDLTRLDAKTKRVMRSRIQMIFQDPYSSLNGKRTVGKALAEPLWVHQGIRFKEALPRIHEVLKEVGMPVTAADKYPHEFSGGQRQRIAIARALILEPDLIVADEAVSALDVSVQAQVLLLMRGIQKERGLSYLFITHDLGVVRNFCDRVLVMYLGSVVESGPVADLLNNPKHPYTKSLRDAAPIPDVSKRQSIALLEGEIPSPANPPSGCAFHPRCARATDICRKQRPVLESSTNQRMFACHNPEH
ncbi:MAG: oligopeptide/dipeptide ABC transporter ATP-binding protein [Pseudomonadota bacterium]